MSFRREEKLLDFLRDWRVARLGMASAQSPLVPVHVRKATNEIVRLLGDLTPRTPRTFELQEIEVAIRRLWQSERSLSNVPTRYLRLAPWVFFLPRNRPEQWLAEDLPFVRAWLAWLQDVRRSSAVVTLLREFFAVYPEKNAAFEPIRAALRKHLAEGRGPRIERWRERADRFGLLDSDAPTALTEHWWTTDVAFDVYGAEAGLVPGLEASALMRRATEGVLVAVERTLGAEKPSFGRMQRSLEWIEADGQLRFPNLRVEVAKALLAPFRERNPEARIQELLQSFLLRTIGDPRSQRQKWQGIPDEIRNVLLRWLVAGSLEDFFRVLDETAKDSHWRYRKTFWSAYLKRDAIRDAWVVLGPHASKIVRREFESSVGVGKLTGGADPAQSVLLMRIDRLTIAEWSHNGKCWIWGGEGRNVPKLYETEYPATRLRGSRETQGTRHDGSPEGRWQGAIAKQIEDETGVRVSRAEYMPARRR